MTDIMLRPANPTLSEGYYMPTLTDDWSSPGTARGTQARKPATPEGVPQHLAPLYHQLVELLRLPGDWNSYGAPGIQSRAADLALRLLILHQYAGRLPHVAPTSRGGVQLEWYGEGDDGMEVYCEPDGTVGVLIDLDGEMRESESASMYEPLLAEVLRRAGQL